MTKHYIIILLLLTTVKATSNAQDSLSFNERQWVWMEHYMGVSEKDSLCSRLYDLSKHQQFTQALALSEYLKNNQPDNEDYFTFFTSSLYNLGMQDSARNLAKKFIDDKTKESHSLTDLFLYMWYPCFYRIGADSIINQHVLDAYMRNYHTEQYSRPDLAKQLLRLYYHDQLIRQLLNFNLLQSETETQAQQVRNDFSDKAVNDVLTLVEMYKHHPGYVTQKEAGPVASGFQLTLIWHHGGEDSIATQIFLPLLKQAMDQGEISPDEYVHQVTQKYFRAGDYKKLQQVSDSLCKIYGCKNTVIYHTE